MEDLSRVVELGQALAGLDRVDVRGSFELYGGQWALPLDVHLGVASTPFMPTTTSWYLVLTPKGERLDVAFYPARVGGISATFAHQDWNGDTWTDRPWRRGKPCLERRATCFHRSDWLGEPSDLLERALWKCRRLLVWVDAAAQGALMQPGDPLELPARPGRPSSKVIGFRDAAASVNAWTGAAHWGFVEFAPVDGAARARLAGRYLAPDARTVIAPAPALSATREASSSGIWIRLPDLPVSQPWQLPETWEELTQRLAALRVDLVDVVRRAGLRARQQFSKRLPSTLMLGFPLAAQVGFPPSRMHWLATTIEFCGPKAKRDGFRPNERNHQDWDAAVVTGPGALTWLNTEDWSSDQLRTRGAASAALQERRVLVIGAGALGSHVAASLTRMGVRNIGIIEGDDLGMGNLTRHALGVGDVGTNKARAVAAHCNGIALDGNVTAQASYFPPVDEAAAASIREFDVIIDCTANDDVLSAIAEFEWGGEKEFVSLSITWKGEGMLAFYASEAQFPAADALSRFQAAPKPTPEVDDAPIEGIGCWHPVFPASQAEVALWGASGVKFIERVVGARIRTFQYLTQSDDGGIEVKVNDRG